MTRLDLASATRNLESHIASQRRDAEIVAIVFPAIAKFAGKVINKRIETAAKAVLPGHVVYLEHIAGMHNLKIWKSNYEDRVSLFLGYDSKPYTPNPDEPGRYGATPETLATLESLLVRLPALVASYNAAIDAVGVAAKAFDPVSVAILERRR
jgi:hypothetical protein